MAAPTRTANLDPDMALIGELLEDISRNPPAIAARKLLVELYMSAGWLDAATDIAKDLQKLDPRDAEVVQFLSVLQKKPEPPQTQQLPDSTAAPLTSKTRVWDPKAGQYKKTTAPKATKTALEPSICDWDGDLESGRQELTQGYQALRAKARYILADLANLRSFQDRADVPTSKNFTKIQAIAQSHETRPALKLRQPGGARSVARNVRMNPSEAMSIAIADLEETMEWVRREDPSKANNDMVRDILVKRMDTLQAALPDELKVHCELALMHVEHESFQRNYANSETMLGDEVKDIPRAVFYVTEDNYAWNMEELVQAITVNKGVMRNPLSREMFTPKDVRGILLHPLARSLAALAVEQHEMSKGVRVETVVRMEALARILLEDQTADTLPSRKAVDEFLVYIATLPELEQKSIEHLKCPAKDSHTGQSYDFSIGEAVRDAKGNRVCFHKTGDFIMQAAAYLRQNRGITPDAEKCSVM
ncbi:hypothetical protein BKA63DRAFT_416131 [Paraphoma chrysanthemicola]|nr:hypothetical protein BKA63DRAFT_416131 [Paraphoma chrysanthemicola]